jgi:hypothetical protein
MRTTEQLIIETTERLTRELQEDIVGPWEIFWHLRRAREDWDKEELWGAAEVVLTRLVEGGAIYGVLDPVSGDFVAAEDQTPAVQAAVQEWRAMDRDPAPGEIGYLEAPLP